LFAGSCQVNATDQGLSITKTSIELKVDRCNGRRWCL